MITKYTTGLIYTNREYNLNANFNLFVDNQISTKIELPPNPAQTLNILNNDFRASKQLDIENNADNVVNAGFNYWSGAEPKTTGDNIETGYALNVPICSTQQTYPCCREGLYDQGGDCVQSCSESQGFYTFLQGRACLTLYGCSNMLWYVSGEDCIESCPEDKPFLMFGIYQCLNKTMCQEQGRFAYQGTDGTYCITDCLAKGYEYYYNRLCYDEICPTTTYGLGDSGECVADTEGPDGMYADDITHLFIDKVTCNAQNMPTYTKLKETSPKDTSRRCVTNCKKTDKPFTHERECLTKCPQYYYSQGKDNACTIKCPVGYYEVDKDQTCRIICKDSSCETCDYTTNLCTSCAEGKYLHKGTCWDQCPLPLFNHYQTQTCVEECRGFLYGLFCIDSCPQGTVILNNECLDTICPENYYKSPSSNNCIKTCPEGSRTLETKRECVFCHYTCKDCFGPLINNCISCPLGQSISDNMCSEDKTNLTFQVQRIPLQTYEFKLIFSKKLTKDSASVVKLTMVSFIEGVLPSSYNSSISVIREQQEYKLSLTNFTTEFVNKELEIKFPDTSKIQDQWQIALTTKEQILKLEDHFIADDIDKQLEVTTEKSQEFFVWTFLLMFIIKLILNSSLKFLWETLDSVQMIYFLRYTNAFLPYMVTNTMNSFNVVANKNPKFFSRFNEEDMNTPEGFFNKDYVSVSFLVNNESILQIILVNLITYILLAGYSHAYVKRKKTKNNKKKLGCLSKKIINKKELMQWGSVNIRQASVFFIKISVFAFLQFHHLNFSTWFDILTALSAAIAVIILLILPLWITRLQKKPRPDQFLTEIKERDHFLHYKPQAQYFECIRLYRKLLYSLILVSLTRTPQFQFLSFAIINAGYVFLLAKMKPYLNKNQNRVKIVSEGFFLSSMLLCTFYIHFHDRLDVKQLKILGWLITFFFLSQLFIELIFVVISAVLKKKADKKAKDSTKKIHPIEGKTEEKTDKDIKKPTINVKQQIIVQGIDESFELEEGNVYEKDSVKRTGTITLQKRPRVQKGRTTEFKVNQDIQIQSQQEMEKEIENKNEEKVFIKR